MVTAHTKNPSIATISVISTIPQNPIDRIRRQAKPARRQIDRNSRTGIGRFGWLITWGTIGGSGNDNRVCRAWAGRCEVREHPRPDPETSILTPWPRTMTQADLTPATPLGIGSFTTPAATS
jgi:hypothetical protein